MRFILALGVVTVLSLGAGEALKPKVLILGIDGCRRDTLETVQPEHLQGLIKEGIYFNKVQILGPRECGNDTVSGPSWSSILIGVWADKHGVLDNSFKAPKYDAFPHCFKRLKAARPELVTASIASWLPIHQYILSASDIAFTTATDKATKQPNGILDYPTADVKSTEHAIATLKEKDPDVFFIYYSQVDETGHTSGFHPTNPKYVHALRTVDGHVGTVLKAVRERATYAKENWLILVCTDHGGQLKNHSKGHTDPEVREVFFIASKPGLKPATNETPSFLVDLVPTVFQHLGIPMDPAWNIDGKPLPLGTN